DRDLQSLRRRRKLQRLLVLDGGRRLCRPVLCSADGAHLRADLWCWQPHGGRLAAAPDPAFRSAGGADLSQPAADDRHGDLWRRAAVPALVHHAAHDLRTADLADMADTAGDPAKAPILGDRSRLRLALLLGFHVVICCVSLTYVAYFYQSPVLVAFGTARIGPAILIAVPFALTIILFAVSRFSFGYFLGFCLYTVVLGYLWLVEFSVFPYEHRWPAVSASFAGLFFLLPALMT